MKPIKTALASYGMSGQLFHAPFIAADPGFELTAVAERSKDLVRSHYPGVRRAASFEELLAMEDVELVIVNTPDPTHYQYAKRTLEAGKHVVVEKPFVDTVSRAEELTQLARSKGLLLTVYQNRRFDGDFLTVRRLIEGSELGRIVEYNCAFERYRPVITESWKDCQDDRVGLLYNLGSHSADQALVLFGMPESLWATTGIVRDGGAVADYYQIVLQYPRLRVNLRASMLNKEPGPNFAVHGTRGSYSVCCIDPQEAALKKWEKPTREGWGSVPKEQWGVLNTEARAIYPTMPGDYGLYYRNIHDTLRLGAAGEVTHRQMIDLIRLLDAAYRSAQSGQSVWFG